jgi:hypothetical protein
METQPFHARLMPALFGTALSERSFSTRLGLWFQRMALLVARQFNRQAEMNYLVTGQLQPAAEAQITAIIAQMDGPPPKRIPNRQRDTTQVIGLQYQGGTTRQVRSDLFVMRADQSEVYFEMKTVKPNKNTFRDMKRDILTIMAMCYQQNAQAYAAMSYNPAGEKNVYTPDYNEFLELGADLIVGRQFWNFIGDGQTYDELLEVAQEVGRYRNNAPHRRSKSTKSDVKALPPLVTV